MLYERSSFQDLYKNKHPEKKYFSQKFQLSVIFDIVKLTVKTIAVFSSFGVTVSRKSGSQGSQGKVREKIEWSRKSGKMLETIKKLGKNKALRKYNYNSAINSRNLILKSEKKNG